MLNISFKGIQVVLSSNWENVSVIYWGTKREWTQLNMDINLHFWGLKSICTTALMHGVDTHKAAPNNPQQMETYTKWTHRMEMCTLLSVYCILNVHFLIIVHSNLASHDLISTDVWNISSPIFKGIYRAKYLSMRVLFSITSFSESLLLLFYI